MSRYIATEKLQALFLKRYDELLNLIEAGNKTIDIPSFIGKLINDAPTADVKPVVRGEWIDKKLDKFRKWESTCNKCGWTGISDYDGMLMFMISISAPTAVRTCEVNRND